ncbi:hypothetical protein [Merismopedia glauca]|uniref:Uncharacterized protein n=1 Tax=Merismopedia glauca CCAP 1448/3 TaxID=1296344 RepID=A0A2T1C8F1_9CYAN|nr:hypothetical protein [Merismopedia glauca]PSB04423.1 hypothetical protein C7B64_03790 [Merismopedia glauca CCAP 1448/3]
METLPTLTRLHNPWMPLPLRVLILIGCVLLLLVGIVLYFFPETAVDYWVWSTKPSKTRLLGAIYLSSLAPMAIATWINRWSPVRLVVSMLCVFTIVISVVSGLNVSQMIPRKATGIWFGLYLAESLGTAYYLWRYRREPPAMTISLSPRWVSYLRLQAIVLGLYGLGLLIVPTLCTSFWPWEIRAFHGQVYSSIFLAGATGTWLLATATSAMELFTLGLTQFLFGSLQIIGLIIVSNSFGVVRWSNATTWLWIGALGWLGLVGVGMMWESWKKRRYK